MFEFTCEVCGMKIEALQRRKRRFCSWKCMGKSYRKYDMEIDGHPIHKSGKYLVVQLPGKIQELHRYIAAKEWGADAIEGKDVHHKDGDRMNNSIENLEVMTRKEHFWRHKRDRVIAAGGDPEKHKLCGGCKVPLPFDNFGPSKSSCDGLQNNCRICARKATARWREKRKERYGDDAKGTR